MAWGDVKRRGQMTNLKTTPNSMGQKLPMKQAVTQWKCRNTQQSTLSQFVTPGDPTNSKEKEFQLNALSLAGNPYLSYWVGNPTKIGITG